MLVDYVASAKLQIEPLDVLVIEDDEDIRESLTESLVAEGMRVAGTANGAEALAYLASHPPPDVILLDLMMPVMDGTEFRARQLADAALAGIPVVIMSANRDARRQASTLAAAAVLTKPLQLDTLLAALESAHAPVSRAGQVTQRSAEHDVAEASTAVRRKTIE